MHIGQKVIHIWWDVLKHCDDSTEDKIGPVNIMDMDSHSYSLVHSLAWIITLIFCSILHK